MRLIITGSDSNIHVNLPTNIHASQITLGSCSIPYSWFNINSTNNKYQVNDKYYFLPIQQYNIYQLMNAINTLSGKLFIITFNKNTFKTNIKILGEDGITIKINFLNFSSMVGMIDNIDYKFKVDYFINEKEEKELITFNSQNLIDTVGTRCIYIKSNLSSSDLIVIQNNQIITNSILFRIPISGKFGDIISYSNPVDVNLLNDIDEVVKYISIQLVDSNLNPINFNGMSYQLELVLKTNEKEIVNRGQIHKLIEDNIDNQVSVSAKAIINDIHQINQYTEKEEKKIIEMWNVEFNEKP